MIVGVVELGEVHRELAPDDELLQERIEITAMLLTVGGVEFVPGGEGDLDGGDVSEVEVRAELTRPPFVGDVSEFGVPRETLPEKEAQPLSRFRLAPDKLPHPLDRTIDGYDAAEIRRFPDRVEIDRLQPRGKGRA